MQAGAFPRKKPHGVRRGAIAHLIHRGYLLPFSRERKLPLPKKPVKVKKPANENERCILVSSRDCARAAFRAFRNGWRYYSIPAAACQPEKC